MSGRDVSRGRCQGRTRSGAPCRMPPAAGASLCFTHDPERAQERAAARKRGGYNRRTAPGELASADVEIRSAADVQRVLVAVLKDAAKLENSVQRAKALGSLLLVALRTLEVGELEQRLAALEQQLRRQADARTGAFATN